MYKMVVEIIKRTWGKCGIKTVKHYNERENVIELWQEMSNIETQLGHSNIANVALKRIRKYSGKKTKDTTGEEKEKHKTFLKVKKVFLLLKSLHMI